MNKPVEKQEETSRSPSVRGPIALGVVASGFCAYGGGLIMDNPITLGSWAGGMVAMLVGVTMGRSQMGRAIENASKLGPDLWTGMSSGSVGQFLSAGKSGRVMKEVVDIGGWVATFYAATPMALDGATPANVALSVGVAAAALISAGVVHKMREAHKRSEEEETSPAQSPANRKRVGM